MAVRGRPRTFDRSAALHRAMEVFWTHGYEGTSIADLTGALGIASPSLYAAFGSKEELYVEAVGLYNSALGEAPQRALEETPVTRDAVEAMLRVNAAAYVAPGRPSGCMVMLATPASAGGNEAVLKFLAGCRAVDLDALRARIDRGVAAGDVPAGTDTAALARFVTAVLQGMSLQARDGADHEALTGVVDCAMAGWDATVR